MPIQFTKIYKGVKSNKTITPLERIILSEIISYQMQGKFFFMTSKSMGIEFGCSEGQAQTAMSNLNQYLHKTYFYPTPKEGGRVKKRRKVIVKDLNKFVPLEIIMETKIEPNVFKTTEDFVSWAMPTFNNNQSVVLEFLKNHKDLDKYLNDLP